MHPPGISSSWQIDFLEYFRDGVFIAAPDGTIRFVNHAICERSGRDRAWWIGRHLSEIPHPKDVEKATDYFDAILRGESPTNLEISYPAAGGKELWVELSAVAIREEDGIAGVIGISRDVTARKLGELLLQRHQEELEDRVVEGTRALAEEVGRHRDTAESLAASEDRYRMLFENSIDGIALLRDGVIEDANDAMLAMIGLASLDEIRGRRMQEFVHPDSLPLIEERLRARARGEATSRRFEFMGLRADGEPRHFEATTITLSLGEHHDALATVRDVTGRKHAEALLKRLLDRQRQAVDLVSHEARNPLTAIKGYVELLQAGTLGAVADRQNEVLARIAENADRLTKLLAAFLELERIEARTQKAVRERLSVAELVDTVVGDYRLQIAEKGLELVVDVPEALVAHGDPEELREALDIIVSNAYRFTSTGRITVRARREDPALLLDVIDEGRGIPESEIPEIFGRFHQGQPPPDDSGRGMGLGLALAKAIVENHGGEIRVASEVDKGSTFRIVLPDEHDARPVT
ncbi:MAG: PAS domain S-box protein [Candidatus Bipolaricaulota bacterium]|nr:MAG: PAS domain S-box protein [Candidatus Bipolaricaulota bacterium]